MAAYNRQELKVCGRWEPLPDEGGTAMCAVADTISVFTLRDWLDEREKGDRDFVLVDVREPQECEINRIPGSILMPPREFFTGEAFEKLPRDEPVVLYCRSGIRSAQALTLVKKAGLLDSVHVDGGVTAWVTEIDPSQPLY